VTDFNMDRPLRIGITCYPTVGGSGILASELGQELADRGHEVHFIAYDRPFRIPVDRPGVYFHHVEVNGYELFKYPDYTLPLSVKMAEVSQAHRLDLLHVHYAVPHATAAVLARAMLPEGQRPKLVTTLHGTDTMLLGQDRGYGPAIQYALAQSDAVTAVSDFLRQETERLLPVPKPVEVIPNFFESNPSTRTREEVRSELGLKDEVLLLHASNLRAVKRIDLLLESAARIRPRESFKLLILAGGDFAPFREQAERLGLTDRLIVRERVIDIEDYLLAADLGFFTSDMESFCLSILEAMNFRVPSVATRVGGVPEVMTGVDDGALVASGDAAALTSAAESLIADPSRRRAMGGAAFARARRLFSAAAVVPRYEALYRRICDL
jgi:N-acetyl-alpha-D-glucosaminyl L-malate synthase BshA